MEYPYVPIEGLDLKITDYCNLHCDFCVNADGPHNTSVVDEDLISRALEELLAAPPDLALLEKVFFTGGEPLTRLGLLARLARVLPKEMFTGIVTNGLRLNDAALTRLQDMHINRIKVSYDTTDSRAYVLIRKGAETTDLDRLERNISRASAAGFLVYLRVALGRPNVMDLGSIYRKAVALGATVLQIKPVVRSGRAAENADSFGLAYSEIYDALKSLADQVAPGITAVSVSCFPPASELGFVTKRCANSAKLYLNTDGNVYTCNYITNSRNRLGSYLSGGGIMQALRERKRRYYDLFNSRGVIRDCPSQLNYLPAPTLEGQTIATT